MPPPEGVPRQPNSYRELLEANSPAPLMSADYLQGYRYDGGGGIPTPAALRDQTVTLSDHQPLPFLCLVQGPLGTPEVAIVHRLMRYMDMPGEEDSGFHDKVLGLLGDIMPHQYPATIEVPSTAFHLVGAPVRVPTTAGWWPASQLGRIQLFHSDRWPKTSQKRKW